MIYYPYFCAEKDNKHKQWKTRQLTAYIELQQGLYA